ncbi:MAG: hypothetical protein RJQ09_09730 [Cyclobacteriaceae bacterium]
MAKANRELIDAFRMAAKKIESGTEYQWGHMGSCNCGHLAQEITKLSKADIHRYAMQKYGDWIDQVMDFCPTSGYPMDLLISDLLSVGLTTSDLKNLEKLSDAAIIRRTGKEYLKANSKPDVILYMRSWADMLEGELHQNQVGDKVLV